jgi:predicted nuclease with RNAse H fold
MNSCLKYLVATSVPLKEEWSLTDDFQRHDVNSLASWVNQLAVGQLVAWDAPLTGPRDPDGEQLNEGDLTQRQIEKFFSRKGEFKVPKGISVQGYAGCQHWTISQRLLGLPRIGPYSSPDKDLPLRPLFDQAGLQHVINDSRACVVEVHPAVGLWLWCEKKNPDCNWSYKRNTAQVSAHWQKLNECVPDVSHLKTPTSDDELDALIAWLLADRWTRGKGVVLLGNARTGSFLVPNVPGLRKTFEEFLNSL